MLKVLFGWPVLSAVALLAIGAAFGVLSMTPPRYRIAEVCFCIGALILLVKAGAWIIGQKGPIGERVISTVLIFSVIGVAWVEAMHWVEGMIPDASQAVNTGTPSEPSPPRQLPNPPASSTEPPKREEPPRAKPIDNPLEIVAFRSDYRISIANNGPWPVHVTSLVVKTKYPGESKSFGLNMDIGPGKVHETETHDPLKFMNVGASPKLGDSWKEQAEKANEIYGTCGMQFSYFSPSDPSFQQIKSAQSLAYDDISGVLYYHIHGLNKEQTVPIVVVIAFNKDACH